MEDKNFEKTANLIIRSTISGWQSMIVFIVMGISETIVLGILNVPILLILGAINVSMVIQWIVLDVVSVIVLLAFIILGWSQSKLIGIFMAIMNLFILTLLIMAN